MLLLVSGAGTALLWGHALQCLFNVLATTLGGEGNINPSTLPLLFELGSERVKGMYTQNKPTTHGALKGVNSDKRHGLETATRELRNGNKRLMSCRNSDSDTGTFRNSDIPSFEIQTEDMDNPP